MRRVNGNGIQVRDGGPRAALPRVRCETGEEVGLALAADRLAEATPAAAAACGAIDEDCIDFEDALAAAGEDGEG